jgi:hypothetical protein
VGRDGGRGPAGGWALLPATGCAAADGRWAAQTKSASQKHWTTRSEWGFAVDFDDTCGAHEPSIRTGGQARRQRLRLARDCESFANRLTHLISRGSAAVKHFQRNTGRERLSNRASFYQNMRFTRLKHLVRPPGRSSGAIVGRVLLHRRIDWFPRPCCSSPGAPALRSGTTPVARASSTRLSSPTGRKVSTGIRTGNVDREYASASFPLPNRDGTPRNAARVGLPARRGA